MRLKRPTLPSALLWLVSAALVLLSIVVAARFPIWAEIDERAHYAYVQSIAEDGQLPTIDDLVSPEVQAITDGTWPRPSPKSPATEGLAGRNYEAFQPPLYYLIAVPAFAIVKDHRRKVFALRAFNAVLLLAAAVALALLARAITAPAERAAVLAAGLLTLAWPGVLVRAITVSNAALELAVSSLFLLAVVRTAQTRSLKSLVGAGMLFGVALLSKLTLVILAPSFGLAVALVFTRSRPARARVLTLASALLPIVLLSPWLVANKIRTGDWTANAAAREQQTPFLYPSGVPEWGLGDLPGRFAGLFNGVLPQEWDAQLDVWWIGPTARGLLVLLLAAALLAALRRPNVHSLIAGLPIVAAVFVFPFTLLVEGWDVFLLRYAQPVLPAVAVTTVAVLARASPRTAKAGLVVVAVALAALWVDMSGAFLFTDVGDRLGI